MSAEKETRVRNDLPKGDWRVVMRLIGLGDIKFDAFHETALQELTPKHLGSTSLRAVSQFEGLLFAEFTATEIDGTTATREATGLLWHGLLQTGLPAEADARIDSDTLVSPDRPIVNSYRYMTHDATRDVRDALHDFDIEPPVLSDTDHAADQLLSDQAFERELQSLGI